MRWSAASSPYSSFWTHLSQALPSRVVLTPAGLLVARWGQQGLSSLAGWAHIAAAGVPPGTEEGQADRGRSQQGRARAAVAREGLT